jgi:hypothetical protein
MATRALLSLVGTLAVVATLWLTLLSGGGHTLTVTPGGTTAPSGAASGAPTAGGYGSAIDAARGVVGRANQDAQRAAGPAPGAP